MAFKGIYWRGRGLVIPGVYANINADQMNPNRLSPANTIALLATCKGGKPQTAIRVRSLREAVAMCRGGDLYTGCELAYDPSTDVPGAGDVVLVRVNNAIQATGTISSQLNLVSVDWGEDTNFIRHKIEAATYAGVKMTIQHQVDDIQETFDNLGPMFDIQYVGSVGYCRMSLNKSAETVTIETSTDNQAWSTLVEYSLANTNMLLTKNLVTTLDGNPDIICTALGYSDQDLPTALLDTITHQNIKTAEYTVTANVGAIYNALNNYSALLNATLGVSPIGSVSTYAYVSMTGGTEGAAVTNNDWINSLATLENIRDIKGVWVGSDSASIHAAGQQHCDLMSDLKVGKRRRLFCGGLTADTIAKTVTRAVSLGDARGNLVSPGIMRWNLQTGNLDNLDPVFAAAIEIGMFGGTDPVTPLTHKTIKVQGLTKYYNDDELETLLDAGVTPLQFVQEDGIYIIVQAISTYQKDANVTYRSLQGGRIADQVADELSASAKPYIGKAGDVTDIVSLRNALKSKLDLLTRTNQNPDGCLTNTVIDGKIGPSYENLIINYDGLNWAQCTVDCHPVTEIDYITIEASFIPASITV
jgi:hypothetical protein